jgi:MFS family permease
VIRPRRLGVDLAPLRASPAYRRLFAFGAVDTLAAQATNVNLMFQLKTLTHSALDVGALGLVELAPIVLGGLYGGVVADHHDRRRVAVATELAMVAVVAAMLANAEATHPRVVVIYLAAAALATFNALQGPSVTALIQQLVPPDRQRQGATLEMVRATGASILGPGVGGLVAVTVGPAAVYGGVLASFAATLGLLVGVQASRRAGSAGGGLGALVEGARYAASRPDVLGTYVIDLVAMTFAYPVALLPFVAGRFHATYALALLYCGLPTGALVASISARWTGAVSHYGRAIAAAATVWGLGIALFGAAGSLALAFGGLVVAGAADAISGIFRMTMWNGSIPLGVRGRMSGIEALSYSVGPAVGQFRVGVMAAATSTRVSLVAGAAACAGGCASLPMALRSLWRFDARSDAHVAAVRAQRRGEFDRAGGSSGPSTL